MLRHSTSGWFKGITQDSGYIPQVSFSQYSGYVTVDPSAGRALFYWLDRIAASQQYIYYLLVNCSLFKQWFHT